MSISVTLYTNSSPNNSLDKTLTTIISYNTVTLKNGTSITKPVLIFEGLDIYAVSSANYMYIPAFDRYYFITDIESIANNLVQITGKVDVLTSFKTEIRNNTGIIAKQAHLWNLYLDDGSFKTYQNPYVITKAFPSGFTTQNYVFAIAGS